MDNNSPAKEYQERLITAFAEISFRSREEARWFLESHQWDLGAAVLAFTENNNVAVSAESNFPNPSDEQLLGSGTRSSSNLPSPSRLRRSRSPSPPSRARDPRRSNRPANISGGTDRDSDEETQAGGDQSGRMVQDSDVERPVPSSRTIFRSFREFVPAELEVIIRIVIIWSNGFTIDHGPLYALDDPQCAAFIEEIESVPSPRVIYREATDSFIRVILIRRQEEDFPVYRLPNQFTPFQGLGRTLGVSESVSSDPPAASSSDSLISAPPLRLVVDPAEPTTSVQIRLADGTRIVSRFNTNHTVRDIRGFIEETRPGDSRDYQLLIMGFPPRPLLDVNQTIEQADIANSVLIQKF